MTTLAAVYAVLALVYAWLLIGLPERVDWRWGKLRLPGTLPKAVVMMSIVGLAFAIWLDTRPLTGWPTHTAPPAHAQFDWATIREPSPGDRGEIDLWLTPQGSLQPRAYRLAYSRQLHKQVARALSLTQHGIPVQGKRVQNHTRIKGEAKGAWVFYPSPPQVLPPKRH